MSVNDLLDKAGKLEKEQKPTEAGALLIDAVEAVVNSNELPESIGLILFRIGLNFLGTELDANGVESISDGIAQFNFEAKAMKKVLEDVVRFLFDSAVQAAHLGKADVAQTILRTALPLVEKVKLKDAELLSPILTQAILNAFAGKLSEAQKFATGAADIIEKTKNPQATVIIQLISAMSARAAKNDDEFLKSVHGLLEQSVSQGNVHMVALLASILGKSFALAGNAGDGRSWWGAAEAAAKLAGMKKLQAFASARARELDGKLSPQGIPASSKPAPAPVEAKMPTFLLQSPSGTPPPSPFTTVVPVMPESAPEPAPAPAPAPAPTPAIEAPPVDPAQRKEELSNQIESVKGLLKDIDEALPTAPDPAALRKQKSLMRQKLRELQEECDKIAEIAAFSVPQAISPAMKALPEQSPQIELLPEEPAKVELDLGITLHSESLQANDIRICPCTGMDRRDPLYVGLNNFFLALTNAQEAARAMGKSSYFELGSRNLDIFEETTNREFNIIHKRLKLDGKNGRPDIRNISGLFVFLGFMTEVPLNKLEEFVGNFPKYDLLFAGLHHQNPSLPHNQIDLVDLMAVILDNPRVATQILETPIGTLYDKDMKVRVNDVPALREEIHVGGDPLRPLSFAARFVRDDAQKSLYTFKNWGQYLQFLGKFNIAIFQGLNLLFADDAYWFKRFWDVLKRLNIFVAMPKVEEKPLIMTLEKKKLKDIEKELGDHISSIQVSDIGSFAAQAHEALSSGTTGIWPRELKMNRSFEEAGSFYYVLSTPVHDTLTAKLSLREDGAQCEVFLDVIFSRPGEKKVMGSGMVKKVFMNKIREPIVTTLTEIAEKTKTSGKIEL